MTSIIKAENHQQINKIGHVTTELKYPNMQLDYENKQLYQQDRQSNWQSVSLN